MDSIRRGCVRLGIAASASLLLSLMIMMFVAEVPQVSTWFLASAALAGAAFVVAAVATHFEQ